MFDSENNGKQDTDNPENLYVFQSFFSPQKQKLNNKLFISKLPKKCIWTIH